MPIGIRAPQVIAAASVGPIPVALTLESPAIHAIFTKAQRRAQRASDHWIHEGRGNLGAGMVSLAERAGRA